MSINVLSCPCGLLSYWVRTIGAGLILLALCIAWRLLIADIGIG